MTRASYVWILLSLFFFSFDFFPPPRVPFLASCFCKSATPNASTFVVYLLPSTPDHHRCTSAPTYRGTDRLFYIYELFKRLKSVLVSPLFITLRCPYNRVPTFGCANIFLFLALPLLPRCQSSSHL